jgi:hypothetical protein
MGRPSVDPLDAPKLGKAYDAVRLEIVKLAMETK